MARVIVTLIDRDLTAKAGVIHGAQAPERVHIAAAQAPV